MNTIILKAGRLVKFSHTIFALPFAMAMAVVATRFVTVHLWQIFLILLALVSARTAAMAWNRLLDARFDALNPRTANRDIPTGTVTRRFAWILILASSLIFFSVSYFLGIHCALLSPLVLGFLFFYSWTKRFSSISHIVLGIALALAPGGVWYALTAEFALVPIYLMVAVALWVAGFDILYSCQDYEFDKSKGLHSVPVRWGVEPAFRLAFIVHLLSVCALITFGVAVPLGTCYFVGVTVFALFLLSQYFLISPKNLDRIDQAFFQQNGLASVVFFLFVISDHML